MAQEIYFKILETEPINASSMILFHMNALQQDRNTPQTV
jgi:hypothetical protein